MNFEDYLNKNSHRVEEYLQAVFEKQVAAICGDVIHGDKASERASAEIQKYLYTPLSAFYQEAGKRHRPLICLLACAAVGGSPDAAFASAIAIEHFHSAALIHDDIADESLTRRALPCLHITEGEGIAINAGDMALSLVISSVLHDDGLTDALKIRVLNELVDMNTATIEGQALDIGWARDEREDLTLEDCLMMARRKTAYYSGAVPLAIGAIIGGGTDLEVETLRSFGMDTGLAFQIQDDLLNIVGDAEKLGKDYRSDITDGKRTFAAIYALNNSGERVELETILDSKSADEQVLARAVDIMEEAGAISAAKAYSEKLVATSKARLDEVLVPSESKDFLMSMADFFIERLV